MFGETGFGFRPVTAPRNSQEITDAVNEAVALEPRIQNNYAVSNILTGAGCPIYKIDAAVASIWQRR